MLQCLQLVHDGVPRSLEGIQDPETCDTIWRPYTHVVFVEPRSVALSCRVTGHWTMHYSRAHFRCEQWRMPSLITEVLPHMALMLIYRELHDLVSLMVTAAQLPAIWLGNTVVPNFSPETRVVTYDEDIGPKVYPDRRIHPKRLS
jgi:hypothetical protein